MGSESSEVVVVMEADGRYCSVAIEGRKVADLRTAVSGMHSVGTVVVDLPNQAVGMEVGHLMDEAVWQDLEGTAGSGIVDTAVVA